MRWICQRISGFLREEFAGRGLGKEPGRITLFMPIFQILQKCKKEIKRYHKLRRIMFGFLGENRRLRPPRFAFFQGFDAKNRVALSL